MNPKNIAISAVNYIAAPDPSPLGKKMGRKRARPTVNADTVEDPREALRAIVARHKRWTNTAKGWVHSASDRKLKDGTVLKCTLPETFKNDILNAAKSLQKETKALEREMMKCLAQIPIYEHFLSKVYGFGAVTCSYLCAMVRIERSVKPSQLIRYCGYANSTSNVDAVTGFARRETRKDSAPKYSPDGTYNKDARGTYNDELKMRIWQGMVAMRKSNAQYGKVNKYLRLWAESSYSRRTTCALDGDHKKHGPTCRVLGADHAGRRKATDLVLEDLYVIWRTLEGLPVWPDLYDVRRGVYHGGAPCVNVGRVLTLDEAFAIIGDVTETVGTLPWAVKVDAEDDLAAE